MSMHRGRVTASDTAGVYVQTAEFGALGPLGHTGVAPAVGASVLLADAGVAGQPDLIVVGTVTGGPALTTVDNTVARFDGTTGALQGSGVTIDDNDRVTVGDQLLVNSVSDTYVLISGGSGYEKQLRFRTGASARWFVGVSGAESTGNAGSKFAWSAWDDSGGYLRDHLTLERATGKTTFGAVGSTAGLELGASGPRIMAGTGTPESVVTAPVGSLWLRTDSATTLYVKQTGGTGNTGWIAK